MQRAGPWRTPRRIARTAQRPARCAVSTSRPCDAEQSRRVAARCRRTRSSPNDNRHLTSAVSTGTAPSNRSAAVQAATRVRQRDSSHLPAGGPAAQSRPAIRPAGPDQSPSVAGRNGGTAARSACTRKGRDRLAAVAAHIRQVCCAVGLLSADRHVLVFVPSEAARVRSTGLSL